MPVDLASILVYGGVLLLIWIPYGIRQRARSRQGASMLAHAVESSLMEPASLHPLIDPSRCLGCATCVSACPEKNVLGLIAGKAVLTTPANCIGHGACKDACPLDAITLVLGTETRGVDIPMVAPDFQTNVPGIFVAGELGGMGLIRNAIEQGRQAAESVRTFLESAAPNDIDVVIIGAGPAGLSASLAAKQAGLRFVTLEQESLGGTVAHYPRGKIVMTAPVDLPLYGKVRLRETTKEALLELWQDVIEKTGLTLRTQERVEAIERQQAGFEVRTSKGRYATRSVILAIGRRGTPRQLGVPGEEHEKVVYRLIDAAQYRDRRVLVVGGGDSALEAALSIADEAGTDVSISYRGDSFSRAKAKNREKIEAAEASGQLRVLLNSNVLHIGPAEVEIESGADTKSLANDDVVVCAGGILPTDFLRSVGIDVETKHGTA